MTPEPDIALAERLFTTLAEKTSDGVGISRDSYGAGEQFAHDLVAETARGLGLELRTDAALNLYMTLPGRDRALPAVLTGSHLDSVPRGGNYDGAAGVLAGLAVLAGWIRDGYRPAQDTTVIAIRAEESAWFPVSYPGSKAALGRLPAEALDYERTDGAGTLGARIAALGGDPAALARGEPQIEATRVARFVELHIEQGPVLLGANLPVGIVAGIRGSFRYREGTIAGSYGHSGATPRSHRHDAVVAAASLITRLNAHWARLEAEGADLAVTFGRLSTDPAQADFSKVPGHVDFCLDVRSSDPATLAAFETILASEVALVEQETAVRFDLGPRTGSTPAPMDAGLVAELVTAAAALGIGARVMPSGAGHDTATFALAGIPSVMIFVRNRNGSHNPAEAMEMADFAAGTRVLAAAMMATAAAGTADTAPREMMEGMSSNA